MTTCIIHITVYAHVQGRQTRQAIKCAAPDGAEWSARQRPAVTATHKHKHHKHIKLDIKQATS